METVFSGLPRLVRVSYEVRRRGAWALCTAGVVVAWWLASWLVGQEVDLSKTLVGLAVAGTSSSVCTALLGRARLASSPGPNPAPPRRAIYETLADARQRHARAAMFVVLGVMTALLLDQTLQAGGTMAGLVIGLFGGLGVVHFVESNRWERAERERRVRLYELIAPRVLWGSLGPGTVYEVPEADPPEDDGEHKLIPLPQHQQGPYLR
jgi:hypothetical protein